MDSLTTTIQLNNGVQMPRFGFGTFKLKGAEAVQAVRTALEVGYRHIDTASLYGNEEAVRQGIAESGVPREDIFLVSKLWDDDQGYESAVRAFEASCERLGTDYLDLYLIHWPREKSPESWKVLADLHKQKRARAVGLSNFDGQHLKRLGKYSVLMPMVNQVELHPGFPQTKLRKHFQTLGIAVASWGPLMRGAAFDEPLLRELAAKYERSVAQIVLRWHWQLELIVIPKSAKPERIRENAQIFDFSLSDEDMERIEMMPGERLGPAPERQPF